MPEISKVVQLDFLQIVTIRDEEVLDPVTLTITSDKQGDSLGSVSWGPNLENTISSQFGAEVFVLTLPGIALQWPIQFRGRVAAGISTIPGQPKPGTDEREFDRTFTISATRPWVSADAEFTWFEGFAGFEPVGVTVSEHNSDTDFSSGNDQAEVQATANPLVTYDEGASDLAFGSEAGYLVAVNMTFSTTA